MTKKSTKYHSLSRRIVLQFCLFTLGLSLIYSLISFVLMYTLEDSFIEKDIGQEAKYLQTYYQQRNQWPAVRKPNMQLHFSKTTLPDDMREDFLTEPKRTEFYGDEGRHYHLFTFSDYKDVYLLAEVSNDLMVRPIRGGVITFLCVSAIIVTFIACFIAWLIGRKTAKPLRQLADLAGGVAPKQVSAIFANQFPNNEIGILAHTLEQSFQRMIQALEREKCFTRDVSHELRTPLAIIKNAIELQQNKQANVDTKKRIEQRIFDAAEQMEKTVNTLLMLAREEHIRADKKNVKIMPIIEKSILDNRLLLKDKNINIIISDSCHTNVYIQPEMLKVLLDNLLSNAFKYTQAGEISVDFIDERLIIKDTGPGIKENISDNLTDISMKNSQGTGFGLSIVKRLCEHQEWQLTIENHEGTRISISLG